MSVRARIKRGALVFTLLAGTALAGYYGHDYWITGRYLETTDDAFVKADYTTVALKIAGYIAEVLVRDNQPVKRRRFSPGSMIAISVPRSLKRTPMSTPRAAAVRNLDAQIDLQNSLIEQAQAAVEASKATLDFADADAARFRDLMKTGAGTTQRAQQTKSIRGQAAARLAARSGRLDCRSEENRRAHQRSATRRRHSLSATVRWHSRRR